MIEILKQWLHGRDCKVGNFGTGGNGGSNSREATSM